MTLLLIRRLGDACLLIPMLVGTAVVSSACSETTELHAATHTPPTTQPALGWQDAAVDQFANLMAGDVVLLDVRTPSEYQNGHLPNAININIASPDFENRMAALDKHKTYLLYCATGRRSTRASRRMADMGFQNLYNLQGGITAWMRAEKPLENQP